MMFQILIITAVLT